MRAYIYIYIYMYVCVCVCVIGGKGGLLFKRMLAFLSGLSQPNRFPNRLLVRPSANPTCDLFTSIHKLRRSVLSNRTFNLYPHIRETSSIGRGRVRGRGSGREGRGVRSP